MKFISLFCATVFLITASSIVVGDKPIDKGTPWTGAVTFCDSDDLSVREIRQGCIDFWYYDQGIEIIPPVVVTTCPPDHATDNATIKGKKPMYFSPNGLCILECPEGTVEVSCTVMRWKE